MILFQMATLLDLINNNLIAVNDSIEFTFKGNHFCAKILTGGLIGQCTLQRCHEKSQSPILKSNGAFTSLTAWTESCLQDVLEEYYTRYSSWKRVIHVESKRNLGDLRDQCKLLNSDDCEANDLYKEIIRLQNMINEMNAHIRRMHNGEQLQLKQWKYLKIKQKETIATKRKFEYVDLDVHSSTENLLLSKVI